MVKTLGLHKSNMVKTTVNFTGQVNKYFREPLPFKNRLFLQEIILTVGMI